MSNSKVFISVGGTANSQQEDFVKLIEERLRSEGLIPSTVGRNNFSADSPLKAVKELMNGCSGMLVIALERVFFERGIEKRGGPQEKALSNIRLATPWNQIESAMAYVKELPILVITEDGIRAEGLLEKGYDWYSMTVSLDQKSLNSPEFNGVLSSWKKKVEQNYQEKLKVSESVKVVPEELTIGNIISNMKPAQLWSILAAFVALMGGIFLVGQHFPAK